MLIIFAKNDQEKPLLDYHFLQKFALDRKLYLLCWHNVLYAFQSLYELNIMLA